MNLTFSIIIIIIVLIFVFIIIKGMKNENENIEPTDVLKHLTPSEIDHYNKLNEQFLINLVNSNNHCSLNSFKSFGICTTITPILDSRLSQALYSKDKLWNNGQNLTVSFKNNEIIDDWKKKWIMYTIFG